MEWFWGLLSDTVGEKFSALKLLYFQEIYEVNYTATKVGFHFVANIKLKILELSPEIRSEHD